MIITKPEVDPIGLYNQKQTAAALHVCRHTLKRYIEAGAIKPRRRKAGRGVVFSGADIIKCWRTTLK